MELTGPRWRRLLHPAVCRAIQHVQFRRVDCRRAERNLFRISRLSSSTGLIPSSRDYTGSSYRDYSIRTLPHFSTPSDPSAGNITLMSDHHLVSSHNDGLDAPLQIAPRRLYDKGANRLQVARLLGFDWLLLFLQPQVKSSSVVLAANCLVLLLSMPNLLARFREGVTTAGANGWTRQIQGRPPRPSCPATTTTTAKRKRGQSRTFGSRQLKKWSPPLSPLLARRKSTAAADGQ